MPAIRVSLALVLAAIASSTRTQAADAPEGRKYAVLVGVSEYSRNAELRNLQGPANDVTRMQEVLVAGGYQAEDIRLLTNRSEAHLKPTRKNIQTSLDETIAKCKPQDVLIVAFAGHGLQFKDEPQPFFCPSDAIWNQRETMISLKTVLEDLSKCKSKRKLILVDACRNDPLAERSGRIENAKTISKGINLNLPPGGDVVALLSCKVGQYSFEDLRLKHGVFFHHVHLGLAGAAADADGNVGFIPLAAYVQTGVREYVRREFEEEQEPQLLQNGEIGVFPIVQVSSKTEAARMMREAAAAEGKGDTATALALYDKIAGLDKRNHRASYAHGLLLVRSAKSAKDPVVRTELYRKSIEAFDRTIRYNPEFVDAYLRRGEVKSRLKSFEAALADYNAALSEAGKESDDILSERGYALYQLEQYDKAIADANKSLELNPSSDMAFYVRAIAGYEKDPTGGWQADLNRAIEMDPLNQRYLGFKQRQAMFTNDAEAIQKSEAQIERVAASLPRTDTASQEWILSQRTNVGAYYEANGQSERADKIYDRANRQVEKLPALQARKMEADLERLEAALGAGQPFRANAIKDQIKAKLPLREQAAFEKEWKEAMREDRTNKGGGLFGKPAPEPKTGLFGKPAPEPKTGLFGKPVPEKRPLFQPPEPKKPLFPKKN